MPATPEASGPPPAAVTAEGAGQPQPAAEATNLDALADRTRIIVILRAWSHGTLAPLDSIICTVITAAATLPDADLAAVARAATAAAAEARTLARTPAGRLEMARIVQGMIGPCGADR